MNSRFAAAISNRAAMMDNTQGQNQWGIVANVDAARHRVKVTLQPSGTVTPWLPVLTLAAGGGWGVLAMPKPGMQVLLAPDAGNAAHLVVLGAVHSTVDAPPKVANAIGSGGTPSSATAAPLPGEALLVHSSGSVLRLCDNGDIYLRPASGLVGIDGTLRVNGDVFDRHGSLDRLRMNYNAHTHPDPQGGSTGTTSNPDPE